LLRREVHVVEDFDEMRAREWFAALDYGFAHYTVALLGCTDSDGNLFVVDEHTERLYMKRRPLGDGRGLASGMVGRCSGGLRKRQDGAARASASDCAP